MPKLKDLGISAIPIPMRPLEAGGGAGCGCTDHTDRRDDERRRNECLPECTPSPTTDSCTGKPDNRPECTPQCTTDTTDKPTPDNCARKNVSAFSPEAVAQLKQQLENHLSQQV